MTTVHCKSFCIQNFPGSVIHLRRGAAHNAGDGERAGAIANQYRVLIQRAFDAIQGGQLLTRPGGAGDDIHFYRAGSPTYGSPLNQHIVIEGMQGLADIQHGIVGSVDDIINRPHSGQLQAQLDLVRTGANFNIPDQAQHETRVQEGIGDLDLGEVHFTDC